jgi:hypothetical protein
VQVSEALEQNPEMREYVQSLEEEDNDDPQPHQDDATATPLRSTEVLDEVDRLLRGDDPPPRGSDAESS